LKNPLKKSGQKKIHPKTNISQICHLNNQKKAHIFNHFEENKNHQLAKFRKPQNLMIWRESHFSFQIHFCVLASDSSILNPILGTIKSMLN